MQMVKNILLLVIVSWLAIIVFMPKKPLYYKVEEILSAQDIILNEKSIEEGFFSLTLNKVKVYVKGIHVVTVEEINFFTVLFYNRLTVDELFIDDSLKKMLPQELKYAEIIHSIVSPLNVTINAKGSFGFMEGSVDLGASDLRLDFNESKKIEMIKSQLKKDEKGWYYETSF
ncbi:MAG: hypothetical protein U9O24_04315 [Campylobacterota bacterium]|nr:hypothetical protein [Campylobacterota bacterium]